jgi:hypothetical protein
MDDRFEKFIADNRDEFDFREPDPRIWIKIEKRFGTKKKPGWRLILQRAALVAVIFSASYAVNELIHRYRGNEFRSQDSRNSGTEATIPGLKETEAYYAGLVNQKLDELKPIIANCPSLEEELNFDMTELDSVYADLKNDLKDNMANQAVIEAIIDNYRLKISILEDLLSEIGSREDKCLNKTSLHAL